MILEAKKVSDTILKESQEGIKRLKQEGITPTLGILRAGDNIGSISYEKSIINSLEPLGINVKSVVLDETVSEEEFLENLDRLNNDETVQAILVFKPLPKQVDEKNVIYRINPGKDVDAMNPLNLGKLLIEDKDAFYPCTPEGVMELLDYYDIDVKGKNVTIINNSDVFGKPLAMLLTERFATVSLCHIFTENLKDYTKNSDILITGAGVSGLITPDMIEDKTTVIDVAITQMKDKDGNFILNKEGKRIRCGDVSPEVAKKAKQITSATPGCGGGTGPITTALLAKHVLRAAQGKNLEKS